LIVDGDLEKNFLNGGFDWRYELRDSVQLSVDTSEFHGGNQSLRITFKGPAVPDAGFFQYVPAHPNTEYRFSAYTKAQDIDSASGPRIAVVNAYSGGPLRHDRRFSRVRLARAVGIVVIIIVTVVSVMTRVHLIEDQS